MKSTRIDTLKKWSESENEKFSGDLSHWRALAVDIVKQKKWFLLGALALGFSTATALLEPRVIGWAIDDALSPKSFSALSKWVIVVFGIQLTRFICTFTSALFFNRLGQEVMQDLRHRLFSCLLHQPISDFQGQPVGRLVTRITNDVSALSEMFSAGFITIIGNVVFVLGVLVNVVWLDPVLGWVVLGLFPFLVLFTAHFSKKLSLSYRESRTKLSAMNSFLSESLLGIRVVQNFNQTNEVYHWYQELNQWYTDSVNQTVKVYAYFQPMITWISGLMLALILYLGVNRVLHGDLQVGVLIAVLAYTRALFQPIREIADRWNVVLSGMASSERIYHLLGSSRSEGLSGVNSALAPRRFSDPIIPYSFKGEIEFDSVSFRYPGTSTWIFKDFSDRIEAGQSIGVVGPTGSGKSTLVLLLLRFYEPTEGRIRIDGRDIREYDLKRYRKSLGWVSQDVFLFSGSLVENISLLESRPDSARVAYILRSLGWQKPIEGFVLTERGSNLSQGEKQIIAFARVVYHQPRIWILDEATSNMDSEFESILGRLLQSELRREVDTRTCITVAHRLKTLENCNRIWSAQSFRQDSCVRVKHLISSDIVSSSSGHPSSKD